MGKGSRNRTSDKRRFDQNYEAIYGQDKYARNCSQENQKESIANLPGRKVLGKGSDSSESSEKAEARTLCPAQPVDHCNC